MKTAMYERLPIFKNPRLTSWMYTESKTKKFWRKFENIEEYDDWKRDFLGLAMCGFRNLPEDARVYFIFGDDIYKMKLRVVWDKHNYTRDFKAFRFRDGERVLKCDIGIIMDEIWGIIERDNAQWMLPCLDNIFPQHTEVKNESLPPTQKRDESI